MHWLTFFFRIRPRSVLVVFSVFIFEIPRFVLVFVRTRPQNTEVRPGFFRVCLQNNEVCPGFFSEFVFKISRFVLVFVRTRLRNTEVRPRPRQSCGSDPVGLCLCPSPTWFKRNFCDNCLNCFQISYKSQICLLFVFSSPWRCLAHHPRLAAPPTLRVVLESSCQNFVRLFLWHLG